MLANGWSAIYRRRAISDLPRLQAAACHRVPAAGSGNERHVKLGDRPSVSEPGGRRSNDRPRPVMVGDELRRQTDAIIELQDLAPQIARGPRQTESRIPTQARPGHDTVEID